MGVPYSALIADDESHLRLFVRMVLKHIGVEVFYEANNGKEAIVSYRENRPDVVIMDINMPGMTGVEALPEIMKIDPGAVVIMLTGQASRHLIDEAGRYGAAHFIRKDTEKDEIIRLLKELFNEIFED